MSVRDWFIAPPPEAAHSDVAAWAPPQRQDGGAPQGEATRGDVAAWAPPQPRDRGAPPATSPLPQPGDRRAAPEASPRLLPSDRRAARSPSAGVGPAAGKLAARLAGSAAVIGRAGEAEPVAAALALALRGSVGAPAAAVIVVGDASGAGGWSTPAARRLAGRLAAHGFEAFARGRLAWAGVSADDAHRATIAGAPAVLAITVPLSAGLEAVVAGQDLAIVVARDSDGPLARLAIASLSEHGGAVTGAAPLPRGLARLLARAGLRAPAEMRTLMS
jgi:hypothetical protein